MATVLPPTSAPFTIDPIITSVPVVIPPTIIPPTIIPPTVIPPTVIPPTVIPPTQVVPPTQVIPPTIQPTKQPQSVIPPTIIPSIQPQSLKPTQQSLIPLQTILTTNAAGQVITIFQTQLPTNNVNSQSQPTSSSISSGIVAAIAIVSVVGILSIILFIILLKSRNKKKQDFPVFFPLSNNTVFTPAQRQVTSMSKVPSSGYDSEVSNQVEPSYFLTDGTSNTATAYNAEGLALYTVPFDNGVEGDRGYVNDTNNDISNNNSGYYHQDDTHNNNALNNNQGQEQQFNGNHQNIVQGSPDIQHRHII